MESSSLSVIGRISPLLDDQEHFLVDDGNNSLFVKSTPFQDSDVESTQKRVHHKIQSDTQSNREDDYCLCFDFDSLTSEQNQGIFYQHSVKPLVPSLFEGKCSTVFCFGTNGSGRTSTFQGSLNNKTKLGLIPRIVLDLLLTLAHTQSKKPSYAIVASYIAFFADNVVDLLRVPQKAVQSGQFARSPSPSLKTSYAQSEKGQSTGIRIVEDKDRGMTLLGASIRELTTVDDVVLLLKDGGKTLDKLREAGSSVEDSQLVCSIEVRELDASGHAKLRGIRGRINVVNLGKFEDRSGTLDQTSTLTKKKAQNAVVSVLLDVCSPHRNRQTDMSDTRTLQSTTHAPFRDSKLTFFLKDTLTPPSQILFIHTINPNLPHPQTPASRAQYYNLAQSTISSLKFSSRLKIACSGKYPSDKPVEQIPVESEVAQTHHQTQMTTPTQARDATELERTSTRPPNTRTQQRPMSASRANHVRFSDTKRTTDDDLFQDTRSGTFTSTPTTTRKGRDTTRPPQFTLLSSSLKKKDRTWGSETRGADPDTIREAAHLRRIIRHLETLLMEKEGHMEDMERRIRNEGEERVRAHEDKIQLQEEQLRALETELEEKQNLIQKMQNEIEDKSNESKQETAKAEQKLKEVEQQLNKKLSELQQQSQEAVEQATKTEHETKKMVENLEEKKKHLEASNEELKGELTNKQTQLKETEKQNEEKAQHIEMVEGKGEECGKELTTMMDEVFDELGLDFDDSSTEDGDDEGEHSSGTGEPGGSQPLFIKTLQKQLKKVKKVCEEAKELKKENEKKDAILSTLVESTKPSIEQFQSLKQAIRPLDRPTENMLAPESTDGTEQEFGDGLHDKPKDKEEPLHFDPESKTSDSPSTTTDPSTSKDQPSEIPNQMSSTQNKPEHSDQNPNTSDASPSSLDQPTAPSNPKPVQAQDVTDVSTALKDSVELCHELSDENKRLERQFEDCVFELNEKELLMNEYKRQLDSVAEVNRLRMETLRMALQHTTILTHPVGADWAEVGQHQSQTSRNGGSRTGSKEDQLRPQRQKLRSMLNTPNGKEKGGKGMKIVSFTPYSCERKRILKSLQENESNSSPEKNTNDEQDLDGNPPKNDTSASQDDSPLRQDVLDEQDENLFSTATNRILTVAETEIPRTPLRIDEYVDEQGKNEDNEIDKVLKVIDSIDGKTREWMKENRRLKDSLTTIEKEKKELTQTIGLLRMKREIGKKKKESENREKRKRAIDSLHGDEEYDSDRKHLSVDLPLHPNPSTHSQKPPTQPAPTGTTQEIPQSPLHPAESYFDQTSIAFMPSISSIQIQQTPINDYRVTEHLEKNDDVRRSSHSCQESDDNEGERETRSPVALTTPLNNQYQQSSLFQLSTDNTDLLLGQDTILEDDSHVNDKSSEDIRFSLDEWKVLMD